MIIILIVLSPVSGVVRRTALVSPGCTGCSAIVVVQYEWRPFFVLLITLGAFMSLSWVLISLAVCDECAKLRRVLQSCVMLVDVWRASISSLSADVFSMVGLYYIV